MIYLVLGSNLGDREWNLEQAKALLAEAGYADGFDLVITAPVNYQIHVALTIPKNRS